MIEKVNVFFARCSSASLAAIVAILILLVAFADFVTGPHVSFSIFYVMPVALASWYASSRIVVLTCLISTATWLTVEVNSIEYKNTLIPLWNAGVRLGFFAITSSLLVALKGALRQQRILADVDGLTGLLNRRAFEHRCQYLFRLSERQQHSMCVCYVDIDRFKQVNDTFGHLAGDKILKVIAAALRKELRETDLISRLGGDEFAIALPNTDRRGGNYKMQEILASLRRVATENNWPIGFSVGVVVCRPPMPGLYDALHHADRLMYAMKKQPNDGFLIEEYHPMYSAEPDVAANRKTQYS